MQCETMSRPITGCSEVAYSRGQISVGAALAFGPLDPNGGGMTARQRQRDHGAGVADHGAAHQLAQALRVGRLAWLAGDHVGGAEFLQGLENARLEQGQQIVQLGQFVLHRGGG